jgi:hypothetical protein
MTNADPHVPPASPRRLVALVLVAILLLAALLAAVLLGRDVDSGVAVSTLPPSTTGALSTSTTGDIRAEVVGRLRKILEIRDQAFRDRSPKILNDVYTEDCPCLEGDKNAIQELIDNDYHIVGGATSVRIREVNQVSERLWLVVADFRSAPLRIEAKGNRLVREETGGSDLFQFALSRPSESTEWLLGRATAYRNGSG